MSEGQVRLVDGYRGLICDLDGVVRRGRQPVPFAIEQLCALHQPVVYATNNASLTPQDVALQLVGLGLDVRGSDVVTSSQAGAAALASILSPGSRVLAVGGPGVAAALVEHSLTPVDGADPAVVAVLQGYGPLVNASDLAEASYAIKAGAIWVATNRDTTLPTDRGVAPGNGALVAAVALATGIQPLVVGKPEPPLYELAVGRLGVMRADVLAVGDRLDTDILGAMACGLHSLWVISGVDDLESFACAPGRPTPTYVGLDLRVLSTPPQQARQNGEVWVCGSHRLRVDWARQQVCVERRNGSAGDPNALLTAAVGAIVHGRDELSVGVDALTQVASDVTAHLVDESR